MVINNTDLGYWCVATTYVLKLLHLLLQVA